MTHTQIGDPRLRAMFAPTEIVEHDARPVVKLPSKGLPPIVLAAVLFVFAIGLFLILNARRTAFSEPPVESAMEQSPTLSMAPPPLVIPAPLASAPQPIIPVAPATIPVAAPAVLLAPSRPQIVYQPTPAPAAMIPAPVPQPALTRTSSGSPLVVDTSGVAQSEHVSGPPMAGAGTAPMPRARASNFANRSTTVPQGYLIPAVLETAFNSDEPGFARAIVSRDVRGFDGTQILIPRGSRLIGDYQGVAGQSQRRAVIAWNRLIRPDGKTIELNSPAADSLGRGGVSAVVNSHFFERLGDALLQTVVGLGSSIADRRNSTQVILVNSGTGAATQALPASNRPPTLTVAAGSSISVFVARDLDFGGGNQ